MKRRIVVAVKPFPSVNVSEIKIKVSCKKSKKEEKPCKNEASCSSSDTRGACCVSPTKNFKCQQQTTLKSYSHSTQGCALRLDSSNPINKFCSSAVAEHKSSFTNESKSSNSVIVLQESANEDLVPLPSVNRDPNLSESHSIKNEGQTFALESSNAYQDVMLRNSDPWLDQTQTPEDENSNLISTKYYNSTQLSKYPHGSYN